MLESQSNIRRPCIFFLKVNLPTKQYRGDEQTERLLVSEEKPLKRINEYGGLRGTSKTDLMVETFGTEEKKVALKIEFNFHQELPGVKCCQSLFTMRSWL